MFRRTACIAFAALMISGSAFAQTVITDGDYVAVEKFDGLKLNFEFQKMPGEPNGILLSVAGPKGYTGAVKSGSKVPSMDLREFGEVVDGLYSYEILGATGEKVELPKQEIQNNGRESGASKVAYKTFTLAGRFEIVRGRIVLPDPDAIDKTDPGKGGEDDPSKDTDKREVGERTKEDGQIGKPEEPKDGDKG